MDEVDGHTYRLPEMTEDALVGMMQALFPYFNRHDKYGMLNDIQLSAPEKFKKTFELILPSLLPEEAAEFTAIFQSALSAVGSVSSGPSLFASSASAIPDLEDPDPAVGEKRRLETTP